MARNGGGMWGVRRWSVRFVAAAAVVVLLAACESLVTVFQSGDADELMDNLERLQQETEELRQGLDQDY